MGTIIELKVGGVSIDWAKNNAGNDHGFLFQEADRGRRHSEDTNYDYYAANPELDVAVREASLARNLKRVLSRLDLIGCTLEIARAEYEAVVANHVEIAGDLGWDSSTVLTFDEYCALVGRYPLASLSDTHVAIDETRDEIVKTPFRADDAEMDRLPPTGDPSYWSEKSYFASRICLLSPYSMLQVFGQCEANGDAEVVWQYGSLVDAGWASHSEFAAGASRSQKILVATEGSSDSSILKCAFSLLRPDIADFFRFIDVDERHPFWGTGNLVKFAEGLVRIDMHNKVLFVLDNDAEGVDAMKRLVELRMPGNMRAMRLPDHELFRSFPAIGPEGVRPSDINGRAAAIECYLDLQHPNYGPPVVRWSNYKKDIDAWHGALEHKDSYTRYFFDQTPESIHAGSYDFTRLELVLDAITAEATRLLQH